MEKLFNNPYKDLEKMLAESLESPPENVENLQGGGYGLCDFLMKEPCYFKNVNSFL